MEREKEIEMNKYEKQKITFFINFNHEFLGNNVYLCDSEIISNQDNILIVKKSNLVKMGDKKESIINSKNIVILLSYSREKDYDKLLTGYLYMDNKDYKISDYVRFESRQIGNFCYDNIGICYLDENIFFHHS